MGRSEHIVLLGKLEIENIIWDFPKESYQKGWEMVLKVSLSTKFSGYLFWSNA